MIKIIFFFIFSTNCLAVTGSVSVKVQKSDPSEFKGLFYNDVDETIGEGPSPEISSKDVLDAIQEEFTDPKVAMAQLEKLKGPGGKISVDYRYKSPSYEKSDSDGELWYGCNLTSQDGKNNHMYADWGGTMTSGGEKFKDLPRYASEGKFYQFKWASKSDIKRHVAKCFARYPGMPELKARNPEGKAEMYFDEEIYNDFYQWFATVPGLMVGAPGNSKIKSAAQCLLSTAMGKGKDRSGNILVLQKVKNSKDSPLNRETFVSEVDHLPMYSDAGESRGSNSHVYTLAFMDQTSHNHLKKNWKKNEIQTQGIWPNYQGGSVASLLGQTLGDELHVHMKACFMSAGLHLQDPNAALTTIYNPYECRDVDTASIPPDQQLDFFCQRGQGMSCFYLGAAHHLGKKFACLPKDIGGKCYLADGPKDTRKARAYYEKACSAGAAHGCYAIGSMLDSKRPTISLLEDATTYYMKGCKLQEVPLCEFYKRGLSHVDANNAGEYESACLRRRNEKKACYAIGLYRIQEGKKQEGMDLLKKSCELFGSKRPPNACLDLAQIHVKDGNIEEAKKILKKDCSFMEKSGCADLYELSTEKEKKEIIEDVCKFEKKKCF